jgi:membrane fusion protein, multidrug efflux system
MKTVNAKIPLVRFRRPLIFTVSLLGLIIIGSIFFASRQTNKEELVTQKQRQDTAGVMVNMATVILERLPLQISAAGTAEAYSSASVKSDVNGQLTEIHFSEGQYVKKGEPLFTIDPKVSQADLEQPSENNSKVVAQQQLAEANLIRDRAQARAAEVEAERSDSLYRDGVVSKEEAERMRAIADGLAAVLRSDQDAITSEQESVSVAEAGVDSFELQSGYRSIRSPIDGLTKGLVINRGDPVSARGATPLVIIEQVNPIYVSFGVPESQLAGLKRCMVRGELQVAATVASDSSLQERGSLRFIDDAVGAGTGTTLLKASFDNKDQRLRPGQLVNIVLTLALPPDAVVVPSSALQTEEQGHYVFVVMSDQTVELRPVVVAETFGDKSVLASGLHPGEIVVTDAQFPLRAGSKVNAAGNAGDAAYSEAAWRRIPTSH